MSLSSCLLSPEKQEPPVPIVLVFPALLAAAIKTRARLKALGSTHFASDPAV
jgi:hypothetical protein